MTLRNTRSVCVLCASALLLASCAKRSAQTKLEYPKAMKDTVVDEYFGTRVPDPYRWLETPDSKETRAWVDAENALTRKFLDTDSQRPAIHARLEKLWNFPRYGVPSRENGRWFYSKNNGLQNQSVIYMQEGAGATPRVVLDPNGLSADGTVALSTTAYSRDGKYLAYGTSSSGSDREVIRIRRIDDGTDFPDMLNWCKFSSVAWTSDSKGFYYNRFPQPGTVPREDEVHFNRVYYHVLGTPQATDKLVFEDPKDKELGFAPYISDDGRFLYLAVWRGTSSKNRLYCRDLSGTKPFMKLFDKEDASYNAIGNDGSSLFVQTDLDAPRGRIVRFDVADPDPAHWKEIVPQGEAVIAFATIVDHRLVVGFMQDAHYVLKVFGLDGTFEKEIPLPGIGSVSGVSGHVGDRDMFYGFTSYLFPYTVFRYDLESGKSEQIFESTVPFDPSGYETEQVFYTSKDGTKIPMFITKKRNLGLTGDHPTLLYGYGGFDINLTPGFSISRLLWLESGGIYAVANLRGGNEYGEQWHQAGMLGKKQNVFDDFIAAGEYLIAKKYTSREKLAINGGSNGGLLVAACLTQRPDLYGAVVCQVPVIDMLRYNLFTVGSYWVPEYGDARASAEQFHFLYAYSPLENVHDGTAYPPTLVTTADTDDRVVPMHAKKFVATLQAKDGGTNPILLRVETKAGHGGGKPTAKVIDEVSDIYAFLFKIFDMHLGG